ncbi:uncharacterized protein B0H18DRAFT_879944 [Fomitopsis serialis]|uniref:uncharacterized protein n=1 Tax=Fomitopsis serialis TaxID=139415 RepID=UPI002007212A|nr:uncharacterized protein B0H18DRAFT_881832 [Neoantrodia serialis]XP_047891010.1 uncharacterized protein B0H18DRAFT_879944 [Neoantrodia serialis]KAH9919568.1 hypothetical protein B0H18DRAFT_881832 [Neoantrodia serialis]KAH9921823.1 hypothetical protein B0H18DRAFT_879944 [Neoantrodia serialis]
MAPPPTYEEICDIASKAVTIFKDQGYECCLFGSTACALFGTTRCPNDVDLVVLAPDENTEYLKQLLVDNDDDGRFFLVPSRNRRANYEVLWYQLPSTRRGAERQCKVDILIPGDLNIPDIPKGQVKRKNYLPVMPLLPLLLLKLQGWTDHRDSNRRDFREKQHVDVEDIDELLSIACGTHTHVSSNSLSWLPADFVQDAQGRIYEYVDEFPHSALEWQTLGFESY